MTREARNRCAKRVVFFVAFFLVLIAWDTSRTTTSAGALPTFSQGKTAEQTHKNIQVLKDLPESQLFLVMNAIGGSLGVHCDYCHVNKGTDPKTGNEIWVWESDDKQKKIVARQMMKMVLDINKSNFGGSQTVTCYSCHRGGTSVAREVPLPPRDYGAARPGENEAALPTAEQILNKYVAAVGGENAWAKVKTVVMKGTLERPRGRSADRSLIIGQDAVEVTMKGPDKYLAKITTPQGVITQCVNGTVAWVSSNNGSQQLSADDLERAKRVPARYGIIKVTEAPERMKVIGTEIIGGREAYVVATRIDANRVNRYFFDKQTGLLVRQITTTETMLTPLLEQVDFEDYRDMNGVKLPFTVRTADVASFDTARRRFTEIKLNVAVEDGVFNMPAAPK
ncbi:MAG TPA: c-type cytochrome [Blastocatellia bacterium]|nr:c-type cytochrome [Blastocatellia bacterium]